MGENLESGLISQSYAFTMNNESDDRQLSTRVNSARLSGYLEKNIRLACKVLFVRSFSISGLFLSSYPALSQVDGEQLNVEASDGGQVKVMVPPVSLVIPD